MKVKEVKRRHENIQNEMAFLKIKKDIWITYDSAKNFFSFSELDYSLVMTNQSITL